jgi:hypothetical protein
MAALILFPRKISVHRSDLQRALLSAVTDEAGQGKPCKILLGQKVLHVVSRPTLRPPIASISERGSGCRERQGGHCGWHGALCRRSRRSDDVTNLHFICSPPCRRGRHPFQSAPIRDGRRADATASGRDGVPTAGASRGSRCAPAPACQERCPGFLDFGYHGF